MKDCLELQNLHTFSLGYIFHLILLFNSKTKVYRYEGQPSPFRPSMCSRHYAGSHDSVIFIPPLPNLIIENTAFPIGAWGYENRLLYEFQQNGLVVTNPCLTIKR